MFGSDERILYELLFPGLLLKYKRINTFTKTDVRTYFVNSVHVCFTNDL